MAVKRAFGIKRPGALRATAKRLGLVKSGHKLSVHALNTLAIRAKRTHNTRLGRQVGLARAFSHMATKRRTKR